MCPLERGLQRCWRAPGGIGPEALAAAAPFLMRHRDRSFRQIGRPGPGFEATFEAIAATGYQPSMEHCAEVATAYLSALKDG